MTPREAQAKLDKIRALVNTDDDGPEGSMGPRWILGQVQEILGGTDAHPRRASSAIWEEMLAEIDRLRREVLSRDVKILKLSTAILPTESSEKLVAELEKLVAELTAAAPADRVLHCWTDEREHAEAVHGRLSPQWAEVWSRDVSGTCMLPQGHDGPHQFTPDDKIGVTFEPANPHPSGCHTEAPGTRDCNSDGHESCLSCSRRAERDEEVWREGGIVVPPRGRDR